MSQIIDREEFDEVVDAIHQIQELKREFERELQALKSDIPDSRIRFLFADFLDDNKVINRDAAKKYVSRRIGELDERKEQIVQRLEKSFSDKNQNLRNFIDGEKRLRMTNPTSKSVYFIVPQSMRKTLYYVLVLERHVNENIPICRSDYKEIERFFKADKCCYPKELFTI